MDIVKLLEEDEDESMHSGADVDAFQAALNRDIEGGGGATTSQISDANAAGTSHASTQSFSSWQNAVGGESSNLHRQHSLESVQLKELHGSASENHQLQTDVQEKKEPPLQQSQPPDARQQGQAWQNPSQIPQTSGLQISEKKPLSSEPERLHNQDSESQYMKLQKMSSQQASSVEQPGNPMNRSPRQVPFAVLLPTLLSQLDKDRAMQLHTLYGKLKKNEIPKDGFTRHMRDIVGDHMLRLAVSKLQQMNSNQSKMVMQSSARQNQPRMPSSSAVPDGTIQKPREVERQPDSRGIHMSQTSSSSSGTLNTSNPVLGVSKHPQQHMQLPPNSYSIYGGSSGSYHPYPGPNTSTSVSSLKPQPHDSQIRQVANNQNVGGSTPFGGATPFIGSTQSTNVMNMPKFERQNSMNDTNRMQVGSLSHFSSNSSLQLNSVPWQGSTTKEQTSGPLSSMVYVKQESVDQGFEQQQKTHLNTQQGSSSSQIEHGNANPGTLKDDVPEKQSSRMGFSASTSMMPSSSVSPSMTSQLNSSAMPSSHVPSVTSHVPSVTSHVPSVTSPPGVSVRTPPKKPAVGQKKPLDTSGSSPPPSSKKQKVSGATLDQSIEQLNDVTAVSGVNLREEEEQLFSGPKEDSRVSEASRRVVQEEEERLLLQRTPLQKKLAEIMAKHGLKRISNDVERCLSLCVEERMRGLMSNIIRLSKQRVDAEKPRHRIFITSDIRQQINEINQKVKEEWEKKQAEADKLKKVNEPEGDAGDDGDKEKDEGRSKATKVNKEEDDKMRTTAANVAARAAVGGDDMLSKWQLMAEQARQKREGGADSASASQAVKDVSRKLKSATGRNGKDGQEAGRKGAGRKFGKNQSGAPQPKVARTISVKDVIAVLEREPQMSKSTLVYRLYEKTCSGVIAEGS